MNIIYDENLDVRTTQFQPTDVYSMSDLNIYIPISFNSYNVFAIFSDGQVNDICRLSYNEASKNYKIYGLTYEQKLRISSGQCTIGIILVSTNLADIQVGKTLPFILNIENYQLAHQLQITQELNATMKKMYDQIIEMTNMNIQLYEKFTKGGES